MENDMNAPEHRRRKKPFILFRIVQWAIVAFFGLLTVILITEADKLSLPGAPIILFGVALAAVIGVAALHSPPLFFRLPGKAKLVAYVGIVVGLLVFGNCVRLMTEAYHRTPEGAKVAAEQKLQVEKQAALDAAANAKAAADAEARQQTAELQADLENVKEELAATMTKLESCFSWGHRLSALEDPVREALHNPSAFEHVRTELIRPDTSNDNVEMTFRAENAFGAMRTATIRAHLVPDSCEVENIGTPQID